MQSYKTQRQRQLDNVQKELLTNYYLQKYNSIMSGLPKQPQQQQVKKYVDVKPKQPDVKTQRMNFKNMILMKKNENSSLIMRTPKISQEPKLINADSKEISHKYSSREEQQNQKTLRKLEQSIINELYRPSPSKMEQGNYKKLQISSAQSKYIQSTNKRQELEPPQENIQITYEEDLLIHSFQDKEAQYDEQTERIARVKEAIKKEFDRRKDPSSSPQKNSRSSQARSSKISVENKIESPKALQKSPTPNKHTKSKLSKSKQEKDHESSQRSSFQLDRNYSHHQKHEVHQFTPERSHQVYFSNDLVDSSNHHHEQEHYDIVKQEHEEIEFLPPTSNYYKNQNQNLVQESFKYQEQIRQNKDKDSEKALSVASSRKSSKEKKLVKNQSKKSIRSRQKSELKDSSKMEMSFVSKISMLSSNQGMLIKQKIEKQLYDNELGPYQSALYQIVELMEKHPKSGPIYAVGQKTLDDRRVFEERRISQQVQASDLKRNIEKIKRKAQNKPSQKQDQLIWSNQLQILRLIRKISTTL